VLLGPAAGTLAFSTRFNTKRMARCHRDISTKTSFWVYVIMILVFIGAVAMFWGYTTANERAFPSEARLYSTPVSPATIDKIKHQKDSQS